MSSVKKLRKARGIGDTMHYLFWCPGCDNAHRFDTPAWIFNGDMGAPTFSPSLLNRRPSGSPKRCHLFLRDGQIQYCGDCDHELSGKTIPLPEWPNPEWYVPDEIDP